METQAPCQESESAIKELEKKLAKYRKTEERLREAEEKFRGLAERSADVIFTTDREGFIKYASPAVERMLYFKPEEVLGRHFRDYVAKSEIPRISQRFAERIGGRAMGTLQTKLIRKDAQEIVVELESSLIEKDDKIIGIQGIIRDVTERIRTEEELRRSEERYRTLVETSHDMIFTVDLKGNFLFTNKAMETTLGYSREQMEGMNGFDLVHPDDLETVRARFARLLEGKCENNMRYRYRNKHGFYMNILTNATPILDPQGQVVAALGMARDVTQLKWVEEALRGTEERYQRLVEDLGDKHVAFGHTLEGEFTYLSPSAKAMCGIVPRKAIGCHWQDLIDWTPESLALAGQAVTAAGTGKHIEAVELAYTHPNGSVRIIEVTAHPVTDETGAVVSIEGIAQDITERKQAEERLEERVEARTAELARANAELNAEIAERKQAQETLEKAYLEIEQLKREMQAASSYLQEEIKLEHNFETMIGKSGALHHVFSKISQVAPTDTTALILGETGTGKELVARAIHSRSRRSHRPLVKINCATLPPNLIESELFGHEKGSFTGAHVRRQGRFELADRGTLFLDEIAELPMGLQAKLLRVLQEGEFERVGSSRTLRVNVRIIASTNRNLEEFVRSDRFREDLWYRLNVFPIPVPPLRERREDIPLLAHFFLDRFCKKVGKDILTITSETMKVLTEYTWPGNVRELENVIEWGVISSPDKMLHVTQRLKAPVPVPSKGHRKTLAEMEKEHISRILEETRWRIGGNRGAAKILGLHPSTLRGRMRKHGIIKPWLSS